MLRSFQNKLSAHSEIFVRVTFGVFMGGLVVLLVVGNLVMRRMIDMRI